MKKILTLIFMAGMLLSSCGSDSSSPAADTSSAATPSAADTTAAVVSSAESEAQPTDNGETSFALHGALSVKGSDLVDSNGNKFQLRGMSTHGLAWYPDYVCKETFTALRDEWNTNCVRLAMYTHENLGYCSNGDQTYIKGLVDKGVELATELGMYVIIDWHVLNEGSPLVYKDEAVKFFDEMSGKYSGYGNVLYEICNEPNKGASWDSVTEYANEVIPVIRANAPNSVVIVGTPTWSQDVHKAAAEPLSFDNIMYTLHFYAATHKDYLRDRMESCISSGLPVFVSEFRICDASGNGDCDIEQADLWKKLIEKYNVSYMCWNLSNKDESSAVIAPGCSKLSGWSDDELSEEGRWIKAWFTSETEK